MTKSAKSTLIVVLNDFILQDSSLMHYIFLGLPIYSKSEITIKSIFFSLIILTLWIIFTPKNAIEIVLVIISSHFVNWFLTGHGSQIFIEYVLNKTIGMKYSANKAINYITRLKKESEEKRLHVMIYGSWSRGEATEHSDIDIFIVNVHGDLLNGLILCLTSLKYRLLAIIMLISVDIYVIDGIEHLKWRSNAKPKEKPIILNDPLGIIRDIYGGRETKLDELLTALAKLYKG